MVIELAEIAAPPNASDLLARPGVHATDRATSRYPGAREGEVRPRHTRAMEEWL
jgi:hypothetical protein